MTMVGWMKILNKRQSALALAALMVLSACGGTPPPLPPPPPQNNNGGFYGGGGVGCVQATGALPLNPTNIAYSGNMVDRYSGGNSGSISLPLYFQTAPNFGNSIQNIVGTANLSLPMLQQFTMSPNTTFCASTTDATTGAQNPGRYNGLGAVQLVMSGMMPISSYNQPGIVYGGQMSYPSATTRLEVRVGYSCDAWISPEGRLYGCVDVIVQALNVYLSLYSQ